MKAGGSASHITALGLTGLLWVAAGCGGAGGGDIIAPSGALPGSVSVVNLTGYDVEVVFLDEVSASTPRIVRIRLGVGENGELTVGELPAETELVLDVAMGPTTEGHRVRRKVALSIDGDLVLQLQLADPEDPFSLQMVVLTREG